MSAASGSSAARFPLLGALQPGTVQRHEVTLPGAALADERWPVISVSGAAPGPALFVNAGVHGGEYPAVESVIQLGQLLNPNELAGTVVLLPVLNLPAFRQRSMYVCPVDNLNPNRQFPGSPSGSYSQQLVHALTEEFIARADYYIDLHGGDIVEDLAPFAICRQGSDPVDQRALELARLFGLPYVLAVDSSFQSGSGTLSYNAGAARGVPSLIAEAGGLGLLRQGDVDLLVNGVLRVLAHLGMRAATVPAAPAPSVLSEFRWIYSQHAGLFYPSVKIEDQVSQGQVVGRIGSLFGDTLEEVTAPVDGPVLFVMVNPSVPANGLLMGIGVS
ncbi:MAG TPA: succinylglutamate desuccinylase/aspartoacylase family protein [Thermomicrobiaceae bacterium]|nr:succinylglutamate desuccinylase/aspartoacylase family protein [Thermomicrobiaceae bacterium]